MIRGILRVVDPATRVRLRRHIALVASYAVLQGVSFVLVLPLLRDLLDGDTGGAWWWLLGYAAAAAVTLVLRYLQAMSGFRIGIATINALHHRLGDHLMTLPVGWFTAQRTGRLGRVVGQGTKDVSGILAHLLDPLLAATAVPAVVIVGVSLFDWRVGIALALTVPAMYAAHRLTSRRLDEVTEAGERTAAEANNRVIEFARAQPVLRSSGSAGLGRRLLDDALLAQDAAVRRRNQVEIPNRVAFSTVVQLGVGLVLAVVTVLLLRPGADAAELITIVVLVARFAEPVAALSGLASASRMTREQLRRVEELLATAPLPQPVQPVAPSPGPGAVAVEFDAVSFAYPDPAGSDGDQTPAPAVPPAVPPATAPAAAGDRPDRSGLDGITLRCAPGTTTAVVGLSGSGKTTLLRLVARFFDVDAGRVRIGGVDVRDLAASDLAASFSMVMQDVYLFDGTIRENIRIGRPDADDAAVTDAAVRARVDEIVERLPDGWDTRVGEGGAALSGGERQRVSLARALLKDAPLLLLDEATSALDPANEDAIGRAIAALSGRATLIVVAHRLHTIAAADTIVVLSGGHVVETGSHDELLALGGHYTRLWDSRASSQGWRLAPAGAGGELLSAPRR
ncbi:ABC transporter ATP-binding protein [Frankia tisae]|uniref:ABC transporter ATP-binding protein n=1 Tax=Frankia tisae TaxID=2950104 RepID=UPI0021C043A3|nr:ABC transporter ATP-binding protein [Frankia tisae]